MFKPNAQFLLACDNTPAGPCTHTCALFHFWTSYIFDLRIGQHAKLRLSTDLHLAWHGMHFQLSCLSLLAKSFQPTISRKTTLSHMSLHDYKHWQSPPGFFFKINLQSYCHHRTTQAVTDEMSGRTVESKLLPY